MTVDFNVILQLATVVISLVALITAWMATRRKDVENRFAEQARAVDDLGRRLSNVERDVSGMPGKDELHELHIKVTEIAGRFGELTTMLAGHKDVMQRLEAIVSRHEDHLLNGGK